jgi:hypothetical protein
LNDDPGGHAGDVWRMPSPYAGTTRIRFKGFSRISESQPRLRGTPWTPQLRAGCRSNVKRPSRIAAVFPVSAVSAAATGIVCLAISYGYDAKIGEFISGKTAK